MTAGVSRASGARVGGDTDRQPRRPVAARGRRTAQRRHDRGRGHPPDACALQRGRCPVGCPVARRARAQRTDEAQPHRRTRSGRRARRVRERRGDARHRGSRASFSCARASRPAARSKSCPGRARRWLRSCCRVFPLPASASRGSCPARVAPAPNGSRRSRPRTSPSCCSSRRTESARHLPTCAPCVVRSARSPSCVRSPSATRRSCAAPSTKSLVDAVPDAGARGEHVIVVGAADAPRRGRRRPSSRPKPRAALASGASARDAAASVAHHLGVSKRRAYDVVLRVRGAAPAEVPVIRCQRAASTRLSSLAQSLQTCLSCSVRKLSALPQITHSGSIFSEHQAAFLDMDVEQVPLADAEDLAKFGGYDDPAQLVDTASSADRSHDGLPDPCPSIPAMVRLHRRGPMGLVMSIRCPTPRARCSRVGLAE